MLFRLWLGVAVLVLAAVWLAPLPTIRFDSAIEAAPADVPPEAVELPPHWAVSGRGGMVVSAHALASEAGVAILRKGGNAMDALLAVQWMLTLVEPQSSGIGGGAFVLYYDARAKRVLAYDGREVAPRSQKANAFLDARGKPIRFYPDRITGGRAVGVPGTVAVMALAHKRHGLLPWKATFDSAVTSAQAGFRASPRLALSVRENAERLRRFPATRALFLPGGKPLESGEIFRNRDLARTLQLLAREGERGFYSGELARDIVRAVTKSPVAPARLEIRDLAEYRALEREPLEAMFRAHRILTMPPPSSGVILLQALALLDGFGRADLAGGSALAYHLKLEAEKLAFADREVYVADPKSRAGDVRALLEPGYVESRRRLISRDRALRAPAEPGRPRGLTFRLPSPFTRTGESTTHISIIDGHGNVVACTSTIEHGFGSAMVVPGRGFLLNNELSDFSPHPEDINSPKPGHRPRSSMVPTMVFSGDRFLMALGSPGGTFIPGSVATVLLGVLNDDLPIQAAVNAPRALHRHDAQADVELELFRNAGLRDALERIGHRLRPPPANHAAFGSVQAIFQDGKGILWGAADPRREGNAAAVSPWP